MGSGKPTIIDVAQAAGVSKSLVSRALRGEEGVNNQTRAHILDVARQLGYRTNTWARSLKSGRTGLIGVVVTDLANPYAVTLTNAIEDAASDHGFDILLGHGRRQPEYLHMAISRFIDIGVDGVIVVSGHADPDFLIDAASRIPLVIIGRYSNLHLDMVHNNDELGAVMALEHISELGHRVITYIPMSSRPASLARVRASRDFAREHDIDLVCEPLEHVAQRIADGFAGARRPSALVVSNDIGAMKILGDLREAQWDVPADMSVVGYDNSSLARMSQPTLTTIAQPLVEMGWTGCKRLLEKIDGSTLNDQIVLDPSFIRGASTGPA